jgi:hypothetical protein
VDESKREATRVPYHRLWYVAVGCVHNGKALCALGAVVHRWVCNTAGSGVGTGASEASQQGVGDTWSQAVILVGNAICLAVPCHIAPTGKSRGKGLIHSCSRHVLLR